MNPRLEAYSRKLEESLSSHHRFPINLEWLVDLFKYKHISSLTTHLKRHFHERIDYKRIPEGQNKRTWSYHISVDCFSRICHYCRHSERKIVAKYWLRKIIIIRREAQVTPSPSSECSDEEDEVEDEEEDDEDEEMMMLDEEDESEPEEEDSTDSSPSMSSSSSPENSPRYSPQQSSPSLSLSPSASAILLPDPHYPLDWSYLKLRSYDITSLYHLGGIHTFHHHHHHHYLPSHHSFSAPCCTPAAPAPFQELFRPSEESDAREEYPMDTSFDTNAFLSIPDDDADDEQSPRSDH